MNPTTESYYQPTPLTPKEKRYLERQYAERLTWEWQALKDFEARLKRMSPTAWSFYTSLKESR